jgi:SSS family solute:Na+ symporter
MKLEVFDILIICTYLASTVVIGLLLKKKAQKNKQSYMLGGNQLPWYMLGLSNASGYVRYFRHRLACDHTFRLWR